MREAERQRIGLLGERFILEAEISRLNEVGRRDLAKKVRLVSAEDDLFGYDILSFWECGSELHIEVKTTLQGQSDFDRFWLSENEVRTAVADNCWTCYRVWNIESNPHYEDLGNIVAQESRDWERLPSSWIVRHTRITDTA
jgi:hypothetical protein